MSETDTAWQALAEINTSPSEAEEQAARSTALEQLALQHARCDDAASACYYLCRSLGAARQLDAGEPGLELLFELLGALADLPLPAVEPQPPEVQGEADGLGVFELCQQLQAAREQSQEAWRELTEADAQDGTPLRIH
ncbi:hypothetical protein G8A07_23110 [Roseateles sp. DAIF2]|uniref:hypothetical protein n=1 Tax=Roseateles sp. DAIF2 TaxID=2714952 RepID=UPI0018A3016D|nr:hypothetical protein [Roseateles sp. DAIF2]QPF75522.1 hypothetical protein G8A07_23110 [Roseateles sp. DAIF2]